ncbi:MAG: protein kinase [Planctomycetes bacterium]|nr:protein kinase [Planctomycetota bacterium]
MLYSRLGRGGMGAVYLGKHLTLLQKQVVKCLWLMGSGNSNDEAIVDRFHQEARIAAEMTHQNLVRVTHIDRLGELHYLVMEYIEGEDVDRRVQRRGRLDERQALTLLAGAASGLGYAHARGIVHRDIKPANLMISTRGEVKVIDLGLARALDSQRQLGATIGTLGTPRYMAPEQWQSANVGPAADVWALGASAWFALAGHSHLPPELRDADAIRRFVTEQPFPELPVADTPLGREAARIVRRCVQRNPAERYADARALAADVMRCLAVDDAVLADREGAQPVDGNEPDADELHRLQELLQLGSETELPKAMARGRSGALAAASNDATVLRPAPGPATGPEVPAASAQARSSEASADGAGMTTPARTPIATPQPTPAASRALAGPRPTAAGPSRNRRGGLWIGGAAAAAAGLAISTLAVPRLDPAALQQEAMAAIYQQRYAEADSLLTRLEEAPAYADQARRLRVDALAKECERLAEREPGRALHCLDRAREVAEKLLIPKDTDDALARLDAAGTRLADGLRERIGALVQVVEPRPGTTVVRGSQVVRVHVLPSSLPIEATVDGLPLRQADDENARLLAWPTPPNDGPHTLRVVFALAGTQVAHTVEVPLVVRRGAVALRVAPATHPRNDAELRLEAEVQNGPLSVHTEIVGPDGVAKQVELGERDGIFALDVAGAHDLDGTYRVRLCATHDGSPIDSPEVVVQRDRTPPVLHCEPLPTVHAGASVLLSGRADEPCDIAIVGGAGEQHATTNAEGLFVLPLPLPAADGDVEFRVTGRDAAGNASAAPIVVRTRVDRTRPAFVGAPTPGTARAAGAELVISGRLTEPGTVGTSEDGGVPTAPDGTFSCAATLPSGAIEQVVNVPVIARDVAGNTAATTVAVFVDRRGPLLSPAAADGGWWTAGRWVVRVEDPSGPCRVTIGGEVLEVDADGRCEAPRRSSDRAVVVTAHDALGNATQRTILAPGETTGDAVGPAWGRPAAGSPVDPTWRLYERVVVTIGDHDLVLRLVRPLRDEELPPPKDRDPRAVALLQGRPPFYLAETELALDVFLGHEGAATGSGGHVFDPIACRWNQDERASSRSPVHGSLADADQVMARWPATQVTPERAQAFCARHGLRLPTEAEWWFVVRLGSRHRYGIPHGAPLELRGNLADLSLQAKAPSLAAFEPVNDGFPALAPVDAFPRPGAAHPWGFHGLLGNVAEWCSTPNGRVVARGGSWLSEPRDLRVDDLRQDGLITSGAWDCVGFRVARDL